MKMQAFVQKVLSIQDGDSQYWMGKGQEARFG